MPTPRGRRYFPAARTKERTLDPTQRTPRGGDAPAARKGGGRIDRSGLDGDQNRSVLRSYWKRTLRLTLALLAVWFIAGYVVAILLAPTLNRFTFLGGPLGFWFAQNGAIYVFWVLILVYALGMNRLDHRFDVEEDG